MLEDQTALRADWDRAAAQLALRAETVADPLGTFVDTIFVDTLKARHHQIVYGRRGTGKTHLFKRLEAELLNHFDTSRLVPIYVNGTGLASEAPVVKDLSAATALSVYVKFIESLTGALHDFVLSQTDAPWWDRLLGGPNTSRARDAALLAQRLKTILVEGQVRILPSGEASTEARTLSEAVNSTSAGASIKVNLADPRSLGWKLGINSGVSAERNERRTDLSTLQLRGDVILPFNQVSRALRQLLALLGDASLVVLFDEWSDVPLDAQPYLADMVKATFASSANTYVKLGCIPGRTRLATPVSDNSPRPIGYEEGDDIVADINLDQIVFVDNDLQQLLAFFLTLLQKHMGVALPWVNDLAIDDFTQFVCQEVFEDERVFAELCQASGGVPRDFLNLMRLVTTVPRPPHNRIQLLHVRLATKVLYEGKRNSFRGHTQTPLDLLDQIYKSVVAQKESYFFLVQESLVEDRELSMLFMEKLVHRVPLTYYANETHTSYAYFQIDYGTSVDLLMSRSESRNGRSISNMLDQFNLTNWTGNYVALSFATEIAESFAGLYRASRAPGGRLDIDPKELIVDHLLKSVGKEKAPRKRPNRSTTRRQRQ
jgi:hypothetical protein